ncbi:hypothetical protein GX51_00469 [Blastomyces parvus]|uniref:Uncharacterized protein n=1 Tax=Blastomyces parvus TaxID=2060905 RepID=A0A2B7XLF8_9EURO|nr:hypothetical protein GX51_00469 [Blastomyces parvus]
MGFVNSVQDDREIKLGIRLMVIQIQEFCWRSRPTSRPFFDVVAAGRLLLIKNMNPGSQPQKTAVSTSIFGADLSN